MNIERTVDVGIYVNNHLVAGQQNAVLQRSMDAIDITNKIIGAWSESIGGLKNWRLSCSGAYMADQEAYDALEAAYMNNATLTLLMRDSNHEYTGSALIVSFPLQANFLQSYTYSIEFLGTGPLTERDIVDETNDEGN